MLDMAIVGITCQHMKKVADILNYYGDMEVFRLGVGDHDLDIGFSYYLDALKRMKLKLESVTGSLITDEKLRDAIAIYNRLRELLKNIGLTRKTSPVLIGTKDFIRLNHASYLLDPKVMVRELECIYRRMLQGTGTLPDSKPRLMLISPVVALGDSKILDLVEEAGGEIVVEDVCEGVRSYWQNVELNADGPLHSIAEKYLRRRTPCAFMRRGSSARVDHALRLVKEFKVEGIIWYQVKMCETYDIEYVYFGERAKEWKVPVLRLESEYDVVDRGPLKTRIESFLEMVQRRKRG
jgi:benzoyl-CoA reductase/2-hydroxyglutaryl-CoA dehydratase subunit BcrC/BadD/HgdB